MNRYAIYTEVRFWCNRVHEFYERPLEFDPKILFNKAINIQRISEKGNFRVKYDLRFCRKSNQFILTSSDQKCGEMKFPSNFYLSEEQMREVEEYVLREINSMDIFVVCDFLKEVTSTKIFYHSFLTEIEFTVFTCRTRKEFFQEVKFPYFLEK